MAKTSRRKFLIGAGVGIAAAAVAVMAGCSPKSDDAQDAAADGDAAASSQTDANAEPDFDYSAGITDDGWWDGVTASDFVTLPDWSRIELKYDDVWPSDEDLQSSIDSYTSSYSTKEVVEARPVEADDTVNIDYYGTIDGQPFDGGSTYVTNSDGSREPNGGTTVTLGQGQFIDGFEDQIVGHEPGETFNIEVTFPDDYGDSSIAGKTADFETVVNYIAKITRPDVTDDWVRDNLGPSYGWDSVDSMREYLRTTQAASNVVSLATNWVIDNSQVGDLPQSMLDWQRGYMIQSYRDYAKSYGESTDKVISEMSGYDSADALLDAYSDSINTVVKSYAVNLAIAQQKNIKATADDVDAYFEKYMGGTDSEQSYVAQYGQNYVAMVVVAQLVTDAECAASVIVADDGTEQPGNEVVNLANDLQKQAAEVEAQLQQQAASAAADAQGSAASDGGSATGAADDGTIVTVSGDETATTGDGMTVTVDDGSGDGGADAGQSQEG